MKRAYSGKGRRSALEMRRQSLLKREAARQKRLVKIKDRLLKRLNDYIAFQRGRMVTPDNLVLVSVCAQLRALLLAPEIGPPK